ncbi:hypothetical protein GX50_03705 [[Emmonsia] crescens]|uniref:Uncharacterized protein n=1 Tax=[Emmonsia] crescens TaxID=73230 RepID=A0A2B7ZJH5_9EURO|nr:hypothetical protein GX50_03705 [Emmonsia crescens]
MKNTSFGKARTYLPFEYLFPDFWPMKDGRYRYFNEITKKLSKTSKNRPNTNVVSDRQEEFHTLVHASSRSNYINAIDTHPSKVPKRPALSRLSPQSHHTHKNKREELPKRSPRPRQHLVSGTRAMATQNNVAERLAACCLTPRLPTTPGQSAAVDQRRQAPNPGQRQRKALFPI